MSDTLALETAAAEAKAARARFDATARELQTRLAPATLAEEIRQTARSNARDMAEAAGETARRNPGVVAAIAGIAAALLLRRPVCRLGRRLFRRRETVGPPRR